MNWKFLTSKEKKEILKQIEERWGAYPEILKEQVLVRSAKNKLYLITRDIEKVPFDEFRINSIGLYIIDLKDADIRLSIEGSQLIGPVATKNVIEINEAEPGQWFKGEDIEKEGGSGFIILKHGEDYVGSGKAKEGRILNFVPKTRRFGQLHPKGL